MTKSEQILLGDPIPRVSKEVRSLIQLALRCGWRANWANSTHRVIRLAYDQKSIQVPTTNVNANRLRSWTDQIKRSVGEEAWGKALVAEAKPKPQPSKPQPPEPQPVTPAEPPQEEESVTKAPRTPREVLAEINQARSKGLQKTLDAVEAIVNEHPEGVVVSDVAAQVGGYHALVRNWLETLNSDGRITRTGERGVYKPINPTKGLVPGDTPLSTHRGLGSWLRRVTPEGELQFVCTDHDEEFITRSLVGVGSHSGKHRTAEERAQMAAARARTQVAVADIIEALTPLLGDMGGNDERVAELEEQLAAVTQERDKLVSDLKAIRELLSGVGTPS